MLCLTNVLNPPCPPSYWNISGTVAVNYLTVGRAATMKGYILRNNYQELRAKSNNYQEENLDLKNTAMVFIGEP